MKKLLTGLMLVALSLTLSGCILQKPATPEQTPDVKELSPEDTVDTIEQELDDTDAADQEYLEGELDALNAEMEQGVIEL